MIETPQITDLPARQTATIRLTIPSDQIQQEMGPAIGEVMQAIAAQGIAPTGPVFSHHFKMSPDQFDFEVGVPVRRPVAPAGRVEPSNLPAARVARTVYRGGYEGLGGAWGEFHAWIGANGHRPAANLWEFYA
ncbi:MAG: GyrI-like domain-containing protein [Pirellulales bacterium]|nr:GyrI-like domain-containing protein [Pirellulales bacterium]